MKLLLIILLFSLTANGQKDTVFIKNMKDYVEGKVNVLVSPSGRKSIVSVLPTKNDWSTTGTMKSWDSLTVTAHNSCGEVIPTDLVTLPFSLTHTRIDTIPGEGPEGVNPYIETAIFENSIVIFCLYEYRVGKETFIDTIAVDYYRKAVFLNPRNYNPVITNADLEYQKFILRRLSQKE